MRFAALVWCGVCVCERESDRDRDRETERDFAHTKYNKVRHDLAVKSYTQAMKNIWCIDFQATYWLLAELVCWDTQC